MVTFTAVVLWASLSSDPACSLHAAAQANDVERIRRLLEGRLLGLVDGPAADELNASCAFRTPLMMAAEAGNAEAMTELLDRGADSSVLVEDPRLGKTSAWCLALMSRSPVQTTQALARGFEPRSPPGPEAVCADDAMLIAAVRVGTTGGVTVQLRGSPSQKGLAVALDESIGNRNLDLLRPQLLGRLNDLHDLAAVQTAVRLGDVRSLTQLADAGARSRSDHALFLAPLVSDDHLRASLLRQLVRITTPTTGEVSLLSWSALNRDELETLEALRGSALLRVTPFDDSVELAFWRRGDESALAIALKSRDPERAVRALLGLGVDLATGAAMAQAAEAGNCPVAEALADAGAELNQVDHACRTPLELAREHGHLALARALEKATRKHPRLANPDVWCEDTVDLDAKERQPLRCE